MATTTENAPADGRIADEIRKPSRGHVCFSFAAYAKAVIAHLRASGVPVAAGLSDSEFAAVESVYGFAFPPDLRSILLEGLPLAPGFPNWRSASPQQLRLLLDLPAAGLLHQIDSAGFWPRPWGQRPRESEVAAAAAKATICRAPRLVPVYRHFYVPAAPGLPGNPVFYVRGRDVWPAGLDLADFFRRERPRGWAAGGPVPAWAATSARKVEVWTELAEAGLAVERERVESPWEAKLERRLDEARRRLREGGWGEKEVSEMVAGGSWDDGANGVWASAAAETAVVRDREGVLRQMRLLSLALLRGGWSPDEVAESMGWAPVSAAETVGDVASKAKTT